MQLYGHQINALDATKDFNRVAYYHDMGLGKTFTGAEKMRRLGGRVNLVICQKSKIDDWSKHFEDNYFDNGYIIKPFDLTDAHETELFYSFVNGSINDFQLAGVINYDLIFRRPELLKIKYDTIMLDESSMIKNDTAKRTKAIMKLKTDNVILLSGTPTGGKYEELYSQIRLLGWNISKTQYWSEFIETRKIDMYGFKIPIVTGYKNIGRLKRKMRVYGCNFLKTDEVFYLPEQTFTDIKVDTIKEYKKFRKDKIVTFDNGIKYDPFELFGQKYPGAYWDDKTFVGDTTLTQMLYERQLCGSYNPDKLAAFGDILDSTNDRLIVFYNFNDEYCRLKDILEARQRPFSVVNGKTKDLEAYWNDGDSVTLIQYQAGAMGLNLQKANKIIYFTPPLSSELYEQSKKRIHRIGQDRPCFYYRLICKNSIEGKIYDVLATRQDYTEKLFIKG
jgi:SNF2 family DNA or RNA helicase